MAKKNEKVHLKEHNRETYDKICDLFKEHDRVAVVQATGSGKSYLIGKLVQDNKNKKIAILSPSKHINEQFQKTFPSLMRYVEFYTYIKLIHLKESELLDFEFDIIILDEFHRLGAKHWGNAVNKILDMNKDSKVLGTTATHKRYLDGQRDMVEELFNGICANYISLKDAIESGILTKPRLIKSFYSIEDEVNKINKKYIDNNEVADKVKNLINSFNRSKNVGQIIKKYITNERKIIIFCENINHLEMMKDNIKKWMSENFNEEINLYEVFSGNKKNKYMIKNFESAIESGFHILFSVNILNEGMHIDGVDCAMFFRSTTSPIIFYQQLGRVITTSSSKSPLIFDFASNSDRIRQFYYNRDRFSNEENGDIDGKNTEKLFELYDETVDIIEELEKISNSVDSDWDCMFHELTRFFIINGHCLTTTQDVELNTWVKRQRYQKNILNEEQIKKLDDINFSWNVLDDRWEEQFKKLIEFKEKHGHLRIDRGNCKDEILIEWIKTQRYRYRALGNIPSERVEKLNKIGFIWNYRDEIIREEWYNMLNNLLEFKGENGHSNVSSRYKDDIKLSNWVQTQRRRYKINKLEQYKIDELLKIGFDFNPKGRKK